MRKTQRFSLLMALTFFSLLLTTLIPASLAFASPATAAPHTKQYGDAHTPTHVWPVQVGSEAKHGTIEGMAFLPSVLWINVGDRVLWTVASGEIHTVTFLPPGQILPPFDATNPQQTNRQGGSHYDGQSYYNSGLMSTFPASQAAQTYELTFDVPGDFVYYCLVHPTMIGIIHVRPTGTHYPFSLREHFQQLTQGNQTIEQDGEKLIDIAKANSNNHYVIDGIGDGMTSIFRFYPRIATIHVGESITFVNLDPMEPHTVTFGESSASDFAPYGNPQAFDGTTPLNSGFLGAAPYWFGTTYTVHFVKPGTFAFRCDLHDYLGMLETVVVLP